MLILTLTALAATALYLADRSGRGGGASRAGSDGPGSSTPTERSRP